MGLAHWAVTPTEVCLGHSPGAVDGGLKKEGVMYEINFTKEDIGKWAFDIYFGGRWVKIVDFVEDSDFPVRTEDSLFIANGKVDERDNFPALILSDHPAVTTGKLEIPIPPPPKKKVVLEPGWHLQNKNGDIIKTTLKIHQKGCHLFWITEPITLVEGEE